MFISDGVSAEICFIVFALITLTIIFAGVRNGIEYQKFMMPILVVLSVIIAPFHHTSRRTEGHSVFPCAEP